jgi:anaphase-promoting complex subunit 10
LKTFLIRILIVANHQHGKDTHLRSVKVYSPLTAHSIDSSILGPFNSRVLLAESTIR